MNTYTIERDIEIDAPVEVVWRTITEPDQIRAWFSDAADLEARPGTVGSLTFGADETDGPHIVDVTVVAAERPHRFSFRWVYPPGEKATADNSMLVTFTLVADGVERTRLRVVETGLNQLDWPDDDKHTYLEQHRHGWQIHGDKLQALFVTGRKSSL